MLFLTTSGVSPLKHKVVSEKHDALLCQRFSGVSPLKPGEASEEGEAHLR